MRILAVDSSSIVATCAVIDDSKLIGEYILNHKKTHSQKLMPIISEVLKNCELDPKDIDVFAASIGPGSFTGLRIGVATVKALAHAGDKKVIGVETLDALAYNLPLVEGIIVPMIDARREKVYTGMYKWNNNELDVIKNQDLLKLDELIHILKNREERIIFNGDGTEAYRDILVKELGEKATFAPRHANMARASSVAELAMIKAKNGTYNNYYDLAPIYIKKSQAELQYEKKKA